MPKLIEARLKAVIALAECELETRRKLAVTADHKKDLAEWETDLLIVKYHAFGSLKLGRDTLTYLESVPVNGVGQALINLWKGLLG